MLYFAYGSNMSIERITQRIPGIRAVSGATLQGHALRFHKLGRDGSGKCDVVRADSLGAVVHGVLYELAERDLAELDRFEGCGKGYERITVTVEPYTGPASAAQTYIATNIDPQLVPFCWYREHVLRGAVAAGLPADYIEMLKSIACSADPDRERHDRELAIYG
jgi:gamma-glutamylcyclotransferase